jgi:hypothetical protein
VHLLAAASSISDYLLSSSHFHAGEQRGERAPGLPNARVVLNADRLRDHRLPLAETNRSRARSEAKLWSFAAAGIARHRRRYGTRSAPAPPGRRLAKKPRLARPPSPPLRKLSASERTRSGRAAVAAPRYARRSYARLPACSPPARPVGPPPTRSGVDERTIRRWTKLPAFATELELARPRRPHPRPVAVAVCQPLGRPLSPLGADQLRHLRLH